MTLGWRNPPFAYLTSVLISLGDTQHNCGMPTIGSFMLYSGAGVLDAFSRHAPGPRSAALFCLGLHPRRMRSSRSQFELHCLHDAVYSWFFWRGWAVVFPFPRVSPGPTIERTDGATLMKPYSPRHRPILPYSDMEL
ncbi:hypothetical protein EDB83DRAFT_470785 [Lactarius deliciosus]|nr:hypothetical protein EDB83DRAFT_470785 [Lactarius deliciosus]